MSFVIDSLLIAIGLIALGVLIRLGQTLKQAREDRMLEASAALERQRRLDDEMAAVKRLQAEVTGRIETLTQSVGQRFDSLQNRVGDGLKENVKETTESLSKLNERLAVIDAAQKNLTSLTSEVMTLKEVLSNKQARGAFGQGCGDLVRPTVGAGGVHGEVVTLTLPLHNALSLGFDALSKVLALVKAGLNAHHVQGFG